MILVTPALAHGVLLWLLTWGRALGFCVEQMPHFFQIFWSVKSCCTVVSTWRAPVFVVFSIYYISTLSTNESIIIYTDTTVYSTLVLQIIRCWYFISIYFILSIFSIIIKTVSDTVCHNLLFLILMLWKLMLLLFNKFTNYRSNQI